MAQGVVVFKKDGTRVVFPYYDMSGNVWEWCSDWYGTYYSSSQTNPVGPSTSTYRVLRGASWSCYATNCRVEDRNYNSPTNTNDGYGLRLAH